MVCKYIVAFTVWWILINLSCAYTIHFTCDLKKRYVFYCINNCVTKILWQVIRKQCDTKYGKSLNPFQPSFKFSKGESLFIPNDLSIVNGWYISRYGDVEVINNG